MNSEFCNASLIVESTKWASLEQINYIKDYQEGIESVGITQALTYGKRTNGSGILR